MCLFREVSPLLIRVNVIILNINASNSSTVIQMYYSSTGDQCYLPPVPVGADIIGEVVPRETTQVSYKCKNHLVLEGPRTSTCDQGTGQWTKLPKCRDPIHGLAVVNRSSFSVISIIAIQLCAFSYLS
jgi:hypothetical protein